MRRRRVARENRALDANYSCKRRGTPLIAIERSDEEAPPTRLVMYRGGAVHLSQGDVTQEACIPRRTNRWISGQLNAHISWKKTPAASTCEVSRVTTRVTVLARDEQRGQRKTHRNTIRKPPATSTA